MENARERRSVPLNQKRKLRGKRELSEAEFKERFSATTMNEDESDRESISGSGEDDLSSTDDDDSSDEDCEGDFMHDSARVKEKQTKRKEKKEYEIATTSSKTSESDAKILFQEEGGRSASQYIERFCYRTM